MGGDGSCAVRGSSGIEGSGESMTGCNPKPEGSGRISADAEEVVVGPLADGAPKSVDGPWPVVGLLPAGEAELACCNGC